jgi:excisionase family DNA binding protein
MRTFTLAEAARLLGTSRSVLYRKIDAGVLHYTSGGGPGTTSMVTEEALRSAGFDVPPEVEHLERLPDVPRTSIGSSRETSQDAHRLSTPRAAHGTSGTSHRPMSARTRPDRDEVKVPDWPAGITVSSPTETPAISATPLAHAPTPTLPDAAADRGPATAASRGHVTRADAAGTAGRERP